MKAQAKIEMYRFLTVDAEMYLPLQKEASMYFVSDVLLNQKKVWIKLNLDLNSGVVLKRSQGQSCSSYCWLKGWRYALVHKAQMTWRINYLPDDNKKRSTNKEWLGSICTTVVSTSKNRSGDKSSSPPFELSFGGDELWVISDSRSPSVLG